mgnify:CR=1 FL=1
MRALFMDKCDAIYLQYSNFFVSQYKHAKAEDQHVGNIICKKNYLYLIKLYFMQKPSKQQSTVLQSSLMW